MARTAQRDCSARDASSGACEVGITETGGVGGPASRRRRDQAAVWERAKAAMPRSISPASRNPSGLISTPSVGATV